MDCVKIAKRCLVRYLGWRGEVMFMQIKYQVCGSKARKAEDPISVHL